MSLLATAVLVGFLSVSAALIHRSRRPESDSPSAVMLQLMDAADELERRETTTIPKDTGQKVAGRNTAAQQVSTEGKRASTENSGKERLRKNSPLAPIASR